MSLQVAGFLDHSTVNGEGFRSVLFLSGCRHNCPGCHNVAMQNFDYGDYLSTEEVAQKIVKNLPLIDGLTLSGGDPFEQIEGILSLLDYLKPYNLNIWAYTGYTYAELVKDPLKCKLLPYLNVLVDGPFLIHKKCNHLPYIGSSNQCILHLKP